MELIRDVPAMHRHADAARQAGRRMVLVPTMGSLHDGHLRLVEAARSEGDHVTVSIFVNPTQFAPGEDYAAYPRELEADMERLRSGAGVDVVYAPTPEAMYPDGDRGLTWVTVDRMGDFLCGARREGHFRGVATVVTKLFNACKPHVAVFGLKDAQQYFILRRMVRDLDLDVRLVGVPTVREKDGLALSSRNRYLSPEERRQAVGVSRAVFAARDAIVLGNRNAREIARMMADQVAAAPLARLDYAEVVDADTLQPVDEIVPGRTVVAAVAAFFGRARLIDNAIVTAPEAVEPHA